MKATSEKLSTLDTGEKETVWDWRASVRRFLAYIAIRAVFLLIQILLERTK